MVPRLLLNKKIGLYAVVSLTLFIFFIFFYQNILPSFSTIPDFGNQYESINLENGHSAIESSRAFFASFIQGILIFLLFAIGLGIKLLKESYAELKISKEKAEESNRLKSAFLANMSHEIRTPMNAILGFSDLLKQPELTGEKQKKYLEIIEKNGERLLTVINDIVDISKVESGQMEVLITEFNILDQLNEVYYFFSPIALGKGILLNIKNSFPSSEITIKSDHHKINAILVNLVKNAIKYCDKGIIEIGVEKKRQFLEFYVKDTGTGIAKDRQNAIFDRFVQADIEDIKALQGSGLGLSISKAFVEMLGGKIWVESDLGKGATFYFTIPGEIKIGKDENKDTENWIECNSYEGYIQVNSGIIKNI
ncbi:MAG TPA: ATP-binding protein [Lutibacter sp.]